MLYFQCIRAKGLVRPSLTPFLMHQCALTKVVLQEVSVYEGEDRLHQCCPLPAEEALQG